MYDIGGRWQQQFRAPWLVWLSGVGGYLSLAWYPILVDVVDDLMVLLSIHVTIDMLDRLFIYLLSDDRPDWISKDLFCSVWQYIVWFSYPALVLPYILRSYRIVRIFNFESRRPDDIRYCIPFLPSL
jgi:hypothetical protein